MIHRDTACDTVADQRMRIVAAGAHDIDVVTLRRRCASGEAMRDMAALDRAVTRERAARDAAVLRRLAAARARCAIGRGSPSAMVRAERYLERLVPAVHEDLVRACVVVVVGFAIDQGDALAVVESWSGKEWSRKEITRTLRWALSRGGDMGYLLDRQRR